MTQEILRETPVHPSNWRGEELAQSRSWIYDLMPAEVADLERALAHAKSTRKPFTALRQQDFPLPFLATGIAQWMRELEHGRGLIHVRGFPVGDPAVRDPRSPPHDTDDAALMLFGLGTHMGTAVSQNAAGDLLGHVRDTGASPTNPTVRLYRTRAALGFHSDGADVVALLCLRPGRSGGASRFVSTKALYAELLRRRPDLIHLLYEPFYFDGHGQEQEGRAPAFKLPICRYREGRLGFFYIPWYIRNAQRHASVPRLTREQQTLLDLIDEVATDPSLYLETRMEPGELSLLKNDTALHARTEYEDDASPERRRHMLRLWLTAHDRFSEAEPLLRAGISKKPGVRSDLEEIHASDAFTKAESPEESRD